MFFRKKEEKFFYPFAYELAESVSPMLAKEFELWYEKDEKAFLNIISFFYFLKSNIKLFKKCDKKSSLKKVSLKQEIINGKNGKAYCEPAEILINKISGDILYMDPPYNTRQYSSNYHVLETIARNDEPKVHGKTLLRNDCKKSLFSSKRFAKKALEEIIKNAKFKYIFMSYNNEGILSLEDIKQIFEKYGSYSLETKEYKKFNSGSGVLEKNTIEYLHILIK